MRQLTEFVSETEAEALSDYLEVRGVETSVRSGRAFGVWVIDDDLLERAIELLALYDDRHDHSGAAGQVRQQREARAKPIARVGSTGRGEAMTGLATMGLIGASALVALGGALGDTSTALIRSLLVVPIFGQGSQRSAPWSLVWGEPWRRGSPIPALPCGASNRRTGPWARCGSSGARAVSRSTSS